MEKRVTTPTPANPQRRLSQAPHRQVAQDRFLLVGPADNLFKDAHEFLLIINQPPERWKFGVTHQLAHVPLVLRKEIVGAFFGIPAKMFRIGRLRPRPGGFIKAIRPGCAQITRIEQHPTLQ